MRLNYRHHGYLLKENYQIIVTGVGAIVVHQAQANSMAEEKVNEVYRFEDGYEIKWKKKILEIRKRQDYNFVILRNSKVKYDFALG